MKVQFRNVAKKYEGNLEYTLENINFTINDREFCVILGPSGCGKTTLLRMIAGLNSITKGDLLFDEKRVNELEPKDRDISMVFQSCALYPHMNVYKNMAFGLKIRGVKKNIIDRRVRDAAKILNITSILFKKPKEISGGQRQRVALGRAIVRKPKLFLMDEPLSNLDAKLREHMRTELVKIHKGLETTTVYVTHDQLEAMTMANKIVLMHNQKIQQIGHPRELYENPINLFVAGFIGTPTINLIKGEFIKNKFVSENKKIECLLSSKQIEYLNKNQIKNLTIGIRSENMEIIPDKKDINCQVKIFNIEMLGKDKELKVQLENDIFTVTVPAHIEYFDNQVVNIKFNKIIYFNTITGNAINF